MPLPQKLFAPTISALHTTRRARSWLCGVLSLLLLPTVQAEPAPLAKSTGTPPQVVFGVVLAEVALARDKPQVAMAAYADLALKYNDPDIFRRTLEVAIANRQPELVLETAHLWVQRDPDSADALGALSATLILLGRFDEAQPVEARYLAALTPPERAKALLNLPRQFSPQADAKAARQLVIAVTTPYLPAPEALLAQAFMAQRAGDETTALAQVKQVRRQQPDSEPAVLLNAEIVGRDNPSAAFSVLADFLGQYPNAVTIRAVYAQQLLNAGRQAEAQAELARILAQKDLPPETLFATAAIALQAQLPDVAIAALNRLLTVESVDFSLVDYNLGLAYELQAEQDRAQHNDPAAVIASTEAIAHYLQVQRGDFFVPAHLRAANLMAMRGELGQARNLLQHTRASGPTARTDLVLGEATLLKTYGDKSEALKLLSGAVAKHPDNVVLRYELGMLAEELGKTELFERSMREVIRRAPNYAQAYNALGFTYADQNVNLKEARTLLDKALSLAPNDPFILDSMGWLCYREKDLEDALSYLNRAAAILSDPEVIRHQVIVLQALGRDDEALQLWQAGMQKFPDNAPLKQLGKTFPSASPNSDTPVQ